MLTNDHGDDNDSNEKVGNVGINSYGNDNLADYVCDDEDGDDDC